MKANRRASGFCLLAEAESGQRRQGLDDAALPLRGWLAYPLSCQGCSAERKVLWTGSRAGRYWSPARDQASDTRWPPVPRRRSTRLRRRSRPGRGSRRQRPPADRRHQRRRRRGRHRLPRHGHRAPGRSVQQRRTVLDHRRHQLHPRGMGATFAVNTAACSSAPNSPCPTCSPSGRRHHQHGHPSPVALVEDGAAYCASKGAVIALTRQVAIQYAGTGVRCNSVCPGTVDSPWVGPPAHDRTRPEQALASSSPASPSAASAPRPRSPAAALYLASDAAAFITGTELVIDGGLLAGAIRPSGSEPHEAHSDWRPRRRTSCGPASRRHSTQTCQG